MKIDRVKNTIYIKCQVTYGLSIDIFIFELGLLKVNVKAMHISTMNMLKMVTDMIKIAFSIKWQVMYELSLGLFTFYLDPF